MSDNILADIDADFDYLFKKMSQNGDAEMGALEVHMANIIWHLQNKNSMIQQVHKSCKIVQKLVDDIVSWADENGYVLREEHVKGIQWDVRIRQEYDDQGQMEDYYSIRNLKIDIDEDIQALLSEDEDNPFPMDELCDNIVESIHENDAGYYCNVCPGSSRDFHLKFDVAELYKFMTTKTSSYKQAYLAFQKINQ